MSLFKEHRLSVGHCKHSKPASQHGFSLYIVKAVMNGRADEVIDLDDKSLGLRKLSSLLK
jgi:hypothetical protein